jgi:quinol monooxygenase YgiN
MKHSIIQYTVKEGKSAENENLIKNVFIQLQSDQPKGIQYNVYKTDENSFIHMISFESDEANKEFTDLAAFKAFRANLNDRIESPPVRKELSRVGSYKSKE